MKDINLKNIISNKINNEAKSENGQKESFISKESSTKFRSTFKCLSLDMSSKPFSYLSAKDIVCLEKIKDKFLINSALQHLDSYNYVALTCDTTEQNFFEKDRIYLDPSRKLSERISQLRFTGLGTTLTRLSVEDFDAIVRLARSFRNIKKITFKGQLYEVFAFLQNEPLHLRFIYSVTKVAASLEQIQYTEVSHKDDWAYEMGVTEIREILFHACQSLQQITMKWNKTNTKLIYNRDEKSGSELGEFQRAICKAVLDMDIHSELG